MMNLNGKSILILLGGMWHDFDGFANTIGHVFEAEGYRVVSSYELDILTRLDQSGYDLLLCYTCLSQHRPGFEDSGPEKFTDMQVSGLKRWVQNGGGLLAAHASTVLGNSSAELRTLYGGAFLSHPEPFSFTVYPLSKAHPITANIQAFKVHDEFYLQEYDPSVELHMASIYQDLVYPMVWSKTEGMGRVAYIAPGHFSEVWKHPAYQRLMLQTAVWLSNG